MSCVVFRIRKNLFTYFLLLFMVLTILSPIIVVKSSNISSTQNVIKIGLSNANKPVAYLENGEMKGIFTDLIKTIAQKNDWSVKIVNDSWPNLVNKLNNNQIDVLGGIAYDGSRTSMYTFSNESIFTNWGTILTNDKSINGLLDLEAKKVAVVKNNIHYTGENGLSNLLIKFHINVSYIEVNSYFDVLNLLKNKTVDVGVVSRFIAMNYAQDYKLIDTNIVFNPIELCFAININKTENFPLLQSIDSTVRNMKKDPSSAYYNIIKKYIGDPSVQVNKEAYITLLLETLIVLIPLMLVILVVISRVQVNRKTLELKKTNQSYEVINKDLEITKNQLEKRHQAQYDFFANISHELRSPLHIISGYTNLLQESELKEDQSMYLKTITKANDNLLRIVSDILSLTQLEKSDFSIKKQKFNLKDILEFALQPLRTMASEKGLGFIEQIDESLFIAYYDDELRFSQLIINIVENAIKYTETGSVTLKMDQINSTENITSLKFMVKDTGVGIKSELLDKIFEPFFKIERENDLPIKGVGLGLTIVRQLVKIFNGSVSISSIKDQGTTFEITIDLEKFNSNPIENIPQEQNLASTISEKRILLIDDITDNMNLLESYLQNYHERLTIDKALGGREAIQLCENNEYDLLFLDIRMPGMDGKETIKKIRSLELKQQHKESIIIATSAYIPEAEKPHYLEVGFDGFLHKPFSRESLTQTFLGLKNRLEKCS